MKRLFDFIVSLCGLIILIPIFLLISFLIKIDSKGDVFFRQLRVGKNNVTFKILKFRTMYANMPNGGLLTLGNNDSRITTIGYFLRKYKLDELPQLLNVLVGDMSLVGPRPEVKQYVDLYSDAQKKVLNVKPGITDLASIEFINECEILLKQKDPNQYYIDYILPKKLEINLKYIAQRNLLKDVNVIIKTFIVIFK